MHVLGWDVTGIDFSEQAVEAVRRSGLKAFAGTLPHPELTPGSFDLITMRHALEHVPNPRQILTAAFDLLAPGGLLEIQVPNYGSWEIEHYGDAAHTLDLPRHLIHWEGPTLSAMLGQCGFADIQWRQECRGSWLHKSARNTARYTPDQQDRRIACSRRVAQAVARRLEKRGRGNELFATARRPK